MSPVGSEVLVDLHSYLVHLSRDMGVYSDGMEYWKPKCHLIWKSDPMGPVLNNTFIVGFSQKVITKKITFFEKYNNQGVRKKVQVLLILF